MDEKQTRHQEENRQEEDEEGHSHVEEEREREKKSTTLMKACSNFIGQAGPRGGSEIANSGSSGSTVGTTIGCSQKIVVALTVDNGQTGGAQAIEATMSQVTDAKGNVRQLAEPYKITVTKTPVSVTYPLTYLQTFNGKLYEVTVNVNGCQDGDYSANPTCGWFSDPSTGRHVYASQDSFLAASPPAPTASASPTPGKPRTLYPSTFNL
eukprot:jgi/Mesen1/8178/ME000044S07452